MDTLFAEIPLTSILALIIAAVIFIVTVILVAKRLIGFFVTLLLLCFAIISGYAVFNHDIVRQYFKDHYSQKETKQEVVTKEQPPQVIDEKAQNEEFKKNMWEAYESIKVELQLINQKINEYIKQIEEKFLQKKDEKVPEGTDNNRTNTPRN